MSASKKLNNTFWETSTNSNIFDQYLSTISHDINNDSDHSRSVFCYGFSPYKRHSIRDVIDRYCAILGR
jgi:hypothetical protein